MSEDTLAKEFGIVLRKADLERAGRLYDLRGAVSTEMEYAGVSHLVQRYVTGHTTSDILYEYVTIDPAAEMQKYFTTIVALLDEMFQRAEQLGLKLSIYFCDDPCREMEAFVDFVLGYLRKPNGARSRGARWVHAGCMTGAHSC